MENWFSLNIVSAVKAVISIIELITDVTVPTICTLLQGKMNSIIKSWQVSSFSHDIEAEWLNGA